MTPAELKAARATERSAWALQRIAFVLESMTKGAHKAEKPCIRCGSFLRDQRPPAAVAKQAPFVCSVCEQAEGVPASASPTETRAATLTEHAAEMLHRFRERFGMPATVVVEVSEERWPALLDALRSSDEWKYSAAHSDRPCEVEIGGVVFRADLKR